METKPVEISAKLHREIELLLPTTGSLSASENTPHIAAFCEYAITDRLLREKETLEVSRARHNEPLGKLERTNELILEDIAEKVIDRARQGVPVTMHPLAAARLLAEVTSIIRANLAHEGFVKVKFLKQPR